MKEPPDDSSKLHLAPGVWVGTGALEFGFARSSGPGGQNVNKVNTKAELWIDPRQINGLTERASSRLIALAGHKLTNDGEIHLVSQEHRSQERNRQEVIDKLRELVLQAIVEPKRRRKTRPSAASKRRRLDGKRIRGEIKSGRQRPLDD